MKKLIILAAFLLNTSVIAQEPAPFSKAVRVGNMLYLAGELGIVPGTRELAKGGIGPETRQALENIRATLRANGSDMNNVVKCFVMLADIDEWGEMNKVYRTFFETPYPARSAAGVGGLALGARTEIECMATVDD